MYPFAQCTRWEKCILQKTGTFVPAMKQWFVDVAPPPPPSPARPPPPPLHMFPPPTPAIGYSGAIVTRARICNEESSTLAISTLYLL